jgi:hypothetical protein
VRQASCLIRVKAEWAQQTIPATIKGKEVAIQCTPKYSIAGSGTIVGRSITGVKGLPKWTYWVMTAQHLFPKNFNTAKKQEIWLYFFSYKGMDEFRIRGSTRYWISPSNIDVAFIGFYSDENFPIIPLAKVSDNLFGVKYWAIGHPYAKTPFIRTGYFCTNRPIVPYEKDRVGCGSAFAPGMSGGAVCIMQDGKLKIAGIVTAWIGSSRYPERFGCATRIDYVVDLLKKHKLIKFVNIS